MSSLDVAPRDRLISVHDLLTDARDLAGALSLMGSGMEFEHCSGPVVAVASVLLDRIEAAMKTVDAVTSDATGGTT
ncbi:hypothetical protein G3545_04420 [Starkeya sp. ORNL1]|uniref:hypothetical protein n=1 Tax=Starkeya sp. ORNL1 TaxID=2709380 RepID=UPI001464686A|nr:hypothetical protein [Starkeya sp. ORNL1]QJP12968.1 hypothetical protein G3545_04420 [Starkeya sp. ORNL1]